MIQASFALIGRRAAKPGSMVLGASSVVGLPKNWIPRFCLPDAGEGNAARGTAAALDAPTASLPVPSLGPIHQGNLVE